MSLVYRIGIVGMGISLGVGVTVLSVHAMSTYQMTLAECQKRTGLSMGLCKSLIKNNLNVASCKKQTGLSDEECAKRIQEIKNDPEFSGKGASVPDRSTSSDDRYASFEDRSTPIRDIDIASWRTKKEREVAELKARTWAMIDAFKGKGASVIDVEDRLREFEGKSNELLATYALLQSVYTSTAGDPRATRQVIRAEARDAVIRSKNVLVEYYRTNILSVLVALHEQKL